MTMIAKHDNPLRVDITFADGTHRQVQLNSTQLLPELTERLHTATNVTQFTVNDRTPLPVPADITR